MRLSNVLATRTRRISAAVVGGFVLLVVAGGVYVWSVWSSIEEVDFDPEVSRELLASDPPQVDPDFFDEEETFDDITIESIEPIPTNTVLDPGDIEGSGPVPAEDDDGLPDLPSSSGRGDLVAYLIAGSDGSPSVGQADVIYLAVTGRGTVLYTIPRSLYLPNPCSGRPVRAALLLRGCPGVASGPSLLALGLSEFTGVNVEGFAVVGYSGFPRIVDALGGITICSDTPRGQGENVIVPAGCNELDGDAAAWWVTSRSQDEFVDGEWRAVAGDDEMSRSGRQSVALDAVITKTLSFSSAGSLVNVAQQVPETFALGGMSIGEAAGLAMSARSGYHISSIPTESRTTTEGTWVLYPTEPFSATLARNGQ